MRCSFSPSWRIPTVDLRLITDVLHFFKDPNRFRELVMMAAAVGALIAAAYGGMSDKEQEQKRIENLTYTQQLDALNNVQGSLNNLMQFVEMQKGKLKESEDLVNSLKSEQEKLKPVVEADRKTVEAILELQAQRAQTSVWRERGIGFALGVLSSILASSLIALVSYMRKRKSPPSAPAAA